MEGMLIKYRPKPLRNDFRRVLNDFEIIVASDVNYLPLEQAFANLNL